jgi:hypothetical protein
MTPSSIDWSALAKVVMQNTRPWRVLVRKRGVEGRTQRRPTSTRTVIACWICAVDLLVAFSAPGIAAEVSSAIALPDVPFIVPLSFTNVTTQLYDNARRGANLTETTLNPANVQGLLFGKLHQQKIEGQVLAQPLYLHDAEIDGLGRRNLIIVGTAANKVYALDAETLDILFSKQLSTSTIPADPNLKNSLTPLCAETYPPYIGVTSTPVIDVATETVFVESFDSFDRVEPKQVKPRQVLHALSLRDQFNFDKTVDIQPMHESADWPQRHRNRAGLLLSKGVVYVAFSSFICDSPQPYAGWVMGYSARDLTLVAQWRTPEPNDKDKEANDKEPGSSGIWQSGRGLVASEDGTIFLMTGNDNHFTELKDYTNDPSFTDPRLANSFLQLTPGPNGLTKTGSFSPKNSSQLSAGDSDLGSSGPILLPGNRLVGGGKQGRVYVLDTATMQSLQNHTDEGFQAFFNKFHHDEKQELCFSKDDDFRRAHPDGVKDPDAWCRQLHALDVLDKDNKMCPYPQQELEPFLRGISGCFVPISCYQYCQAYGPNIHAGFVFWQLDDSSGLLYAMPEKENVEAFEYDVLKGTVGEKPVATSKLIVPDGMPGGALSVSANGNQDGIVWVSMPNQADATHGIHRGSLAALNARTLSQLWIDPCIFYFAKFNPPIVADGRVFLATFADPSSATTPGDSCDKPDPPLKGTSEKSDPDLSKPGGAANPDEWLKVGRAWIISYGLKSAPASLTPLQPADVLAALQGVGVGFSVPEAELRDWLSNAEFTPYPAMAQALLALLRPRPLRQPVPIDVIVSNYEQTSGASSPRKAGEVDQNVLKKAILEGYNERHLPAARSFEETLR